MRQRVRNSVLSAVVVGAATVGLMVQPSAYAHVPSSGYHSMSYHYPDAWWQSNNLNVSVHRGDTLAGEYASRLEDAANQWNSFGANFSFTWQGYSSAGANCDTPNRNLSYRGVISGSSIAYTQRCVEYEDGNPTNRMTGFYIKFDYPPTASDWYKGGAGTTPPSDQYDFFSAAVHELGHATGGWPKLSETDDRHMRDSDTSDCPATPAGTVTSYRQTMCQSLIMGTSYARTPSGYHDEPIFDTRY